MTQDPPAPPSPLQPRRIDHVVLRVTDMDRAIAFYSAVLGCAVARRRDDLGLVHLRAGASMIDLVDVAGPSGRGGGAAAGDTGRNMDHLCLSFDTFDEAALMAHLDAHGIAHAAHGQVNYGAEGEGLSVYVDDPDGNAVEIKCYGARGVAGAGSA